MSEGFRCAVYDCPVLAGRTQGRCPEPETLCEYVRCSVDPEDMPTFDEWVAQHGPSKRAPAQSWSAPRPGARPVRGR